MALETIDIEYIGNKERKRDTVSETGVEWFGKGDIQPYPSNLASKLLSFKEIWRRADGKGANAATLSDPKPEPAKDPEPAATDGEREAKIKEALAQMSSEDFNGQGYPVIAKVRKLTGIEDLQAKEVNLIFRASAE